MSSEALSNLSSRDLNRLYSEADDYDVIIKVGEESNSKEFKAHSNLLRIKSTYFNAALSSNWAKREGNIIIFKKPNIKPNIFKMILNYIYTGTIALDAVIVRMNLIELLIAADEINFDDLVNYIQKYIVALNQELPEKSVIEFFNNLSYHHQGVFNILYEHLKGFISNNPKRFFNDSDLYLKLENNALLSLIQNDYFQMEEIEIWDNLLKWAIAKNSTISSYTSHWKSKEVEVIKQTIHQFIPYIRFFQISLWDYCNKIYPLSALLPENLEKDVNLHFIDLESPLNSKVLPPRIIYSRIIKVDHIYRISYWIDRKRGKASHSLREFQYEFNLLLRGSRDGFYAKHFKKNCYNKGPTVVIIKLKGEDIIIGGYNPINWSGAGEFLLTNDSFIFSFQSTLKSSTTILSRVKDNENAIYDSKYNNHGFGCDLRIFEKIYVCKYYESRIIETSSFEVEDYEVFQIVKKK